MTIITSKEPPSQKMLGVRQLKQFFVTGGGSNSATDTEDYATDSSRPPSSTHKSRVKNDEVYKKLLQLKMKLDQEEDILISERTMKVLQERQSRRESIKSSQSINSSPSLTVSPSSQPLAEQVSATSVNLKVEAKKEETKKVDVKRISSSPRLVSPRKTPSTSNNEKVEPEPKTKKNDNLLEAKQAGGRIFVQNRLKSPKTKPVERQQITSPKSVPKHQLPIKIVKVDDVEPSPPPPPTPPKSPPKPEKHTRSSSLVISISSKCTKPDPSPEPTVIEQPKSTNMTSQLILDELPADNKKEFREKEPMETKTSPPSFVRELENTSFTGNTNLVLDVVLNGYPRPTLSLFKNGIEMKINQYRLKWSANKVELILFPEFWKTDAILTTLAVNDFGEARTECIIFPFGSLSEEHELYDHETDVEIDSSDISDVAKELHLEAVNAEDFEDDDYLPRELSPIFEVTEDEFSVSHSIRSSACSRRSSIRSIESIKSTLTVLTPTQSITKSPTIEMISVTGTTVSPPEKKTLQPLVEQNDQFDDNASTPTPDDVLSETKEKPRRGSLASKGTVGYDDDMFSIDSYMTTETVDPLVESNYRSTEELMSFVTQNFVAKTCMTETETETETETVVTPTTTVEEVVASPSNQHLFPTPTETVMPESPNSSVKTFSTISTHKDDEQTRYEEVLRRQNEVRRKVREKVRQEMNFETTTDSDAGPLIAQPRRHKKMTEEERQKKERKIAFQQKYRLTQRFIEDSIKGNATSLELTQRAMNESNRLLTPVGQMSLMNDSDVFLDTDDDGMDTVSEVTIDLGGRRSTTRTPRDEFNMFEAYGENFIDL